MACKKLTTNAGRPDTKRRAPPTAMIDVTVLLLLFFLLTFTFNQAVRAEFKEIGFAPSG